MSTLFFVGLCAWPAGSGTATAAARMTAAGECECPCEPGWQPHCQEACCSSHSKCTPASGSIVSKDDTSKAFVVHPKKGADVTFMTNDKTSYWHGKKSATWADVAAGDNVHVTCTRDGTAKVAKLVKIAAPKPTK